MEREREWKRLIIQFISLATYQLSEEGQRERRRKRMKQYNQLKEVRSRKNNHKPIKKEPKYCSLKIRLNEKQYKALQESSLELNISMAEYARRKIYS